MSYTQVAKSYDAARAEMLEIARIKNDFMARLEMAGLSLPPPNSRGGSASVFLSIEDVLMAPFAEMGGRTGRG